MTPVNARKTMIGIIGDSDCSEETGRLAEEVGYLIAQKGGAVICGGYGGVMEAASRGAKRGGGMTVGVLSGKEAGESNAYIDIPIITGMRDARNVIIARSADGLIAVGGGFGTLSEIGFALKFSKPLIAIHSWNLTHSDPSKNFPVLQAKNASEAVNILFGLLSQ